MLLHYLFNSRAYCAPKQSPYSEQKANDSLIEAAFRKRAVALRES